jgi:hypothetical protein
MVPSARWSVASLKREQSSKTESLRQTSADRGRNSHPGIASNVFWLRELSIISPPVTQVAIE